MQMVTRREFLRAAGGVAVATAYPRAGVPLRHWAWMQPRLGRSTDDWKREFALMKSSGVSAVNVEIYNGREAFYRSRDVHAWMWTMPYLLADVLQAHQDWYNVNAKGESAATKPAYVDYYRFLDPARPEVREFVRDTVAEIAQVSGLKGIHLDYVRHPDAILPSGLWSKYGIVQDKVYPQYDYGYTEYSRKAFKRVHGIDPIELKDPESNRAWLQYRLDSVVDLVNDYLVPAAHAGGKTISAAVFPGPSRARIMVRQDWGRFTLDAFFPMLYHTFYDATPAFVKTYTQEAVATVKQPVYSGIYVPPLDPRELARTAEMALEGGASGVSIFDADAMTPEKWRAFADAVR